MQPLIEPEPRADPPSWERWTVARAVIAGVMIGGMGLVAAYPLGVAIVLNLTWWGVGPTSGERQLAALLTLVGASIFAAGPVGVWLLRRRCMWLRVGLACLGLGFMGAIGVLTG